MNVGIGNTRPHSLISRIFGTVQEHVLLIIKKLIGNTEAYGGQSYEIDSYLADKTAKWTLRLILKYVCCGEKTCNVSACDEAQVGLPLSEADSAFTPQ
jgi:hypothetical protein